MRLTDRLRALNRIGMELMREHDLGMLLGQILATAKALTMSDGAALFLVEADAAAPELVLFRADFDSLAQAEITQTRLPIDDTSIAGHAARTHQPAKSPTVKSKLRR